MAVIIAGDRSGSGKTTITLSLLSFLTQKGYSVQSFKVGPDYIDPMFHQSITHKPCRNLDPILTSENYVKNCFVTHDQLADCSIIEGVMGLFDGVPSLKSDQWDYSSTAHIAKLLNIPILLVIDCSKLSGSILAIIHGYASIDPQLKIAGVILNKVGTQRHYHLLANALQSLSIPIMGVCYREDEITIPERYLGLIPTGEIPQVKAIFDRLYSFAEKCFHWETLLPFIVDRQTQLSRSSLSQIPNHYSSSKTKIGIAYDEAFNFYYADNLEILQQLGAELIYFSPLHDSHLPEGLEGFYFGGGFPEIFAEQLANNHTIKQELCQAILSGKPTYAECGGLMYFCEKIVDFNEHHYAMLGLFPTTAKMGKKLVLGYRQGKVLENSYFLQKDERVWGHEFHRSTLITTPVSPVYQLRGYHYAETVEGWKKDNIHASYLHLHWGEQMTIAQRLIKNSNSPELLAIKGN